MKNISIIALFFVLHNNLFAQVEEGKEDVEARSKYEFEKIKDPLNDENPTYKLNFAQNKTKNLRVAAAIPNITWSERGPSNIGGRTRAFMFDPNDLTNRKVWAGSVSGGLWFNLNITNPTSPWVKVNDFWENLAVTSITYDPNNKNTFYVSTGEGWGNSDATVGGGVWKSIDGGINWFRLTSSIPSSTNSSFAKIQKILVGYDSIVWLATSGALFKSSDGGINWQSVLNNGFFCDLEIGTDGIIYTTYKVNNNSYILKSKNSTGSNWTDITPDNEAQRVEIDLFEPSSGNSQILYSIGIKNQSNLDVKYIMKSINGGASWEKCNVPYYPYGYQFTSGLGWYALSLKVHPTNSNMIYVGGTNFTRSIDGGKNWNISMDYVRTHPDIHKFVFRPNNPNELMITNDGGVYYSANFGNSTISNPTFDSRNLNYNVTQFYSLAIKNIIGDGYVIGGAQDNGTQRVNTSINEIGSGSEINSGGDGTLCFIDQDDPNIQISSSQYGNYRLHDSNGNFKKQLSGNTSAFEFIAPADYDDVNNTLYSFLSVRTLPTGTVTRINKIANIGTTDNESILLVNDEIYAKHIKVGKSPNTLFIGTKSGCKVFKITNTNQATANSICIGNGFPTDASTIVSNIDVGIDDNELLVTFSNYGVKSIYYTSDGGTNWISKDELAHGLPDMPVRWGIFNPNNYNQVLLATELGVWSSNDFKASNPNWEPSNSNLGNLRCNMLKYRNSDGIVAVATYGRGFFFSDVFKKNLPYINLTYNIARLCSNSNITVPFISSNTFQNNNIFQLQLSDNQGSFSQPIILGSSATNSISGIIPSNTSLNGKHKIRIVSTSPLIISNTKDITVVSPYAQIYLDPYNANNNGCPDATLKLYGVHDPFDAKATYSWTGPNGFTSTSKNIDFSLFNNSLVGNYRFTANFTEGCSGTFTSTLQINKQVLPSIISPNLLNFKYGETISFNVSGNDSYYLSTPDGYRYYSSSPNTTFNVGSATYLQNGIYRVIGNSGGCSQTTPLKIIINPDCSNQVLNVAFPITYGEHTFKVNNEIISNQVVKPGAELILNSSNTILLTPGFETKSITNFQAVIGGCVNNVTNTINKQK